VNLNHMLTVYRFRWVACQIDALESCLDYRSLKAALVSLPNTLDETYNRILRSMPLEHKGYAVRILQFLTYSDRPLTLGEAVDALAVDVESTVHFHPRYRMPDPQEILHYCSSLVVLRARTYSSTGGHSKHAELKLAHSSVGEFLISNRLDDSIAQSLQEKTARTSIAVVCLSYLLHFERYLPAGDIVEEFPFAQYAARYWMHNAKVAKNMDLRLLTKIERFFCDQEVAYNICYSLFRPDESLIGIFPSQETKPASALYYAAFGNLVEVVSLLLAKGVHVDAQGGVYGNPLQAASRGGYIEVVELLLKAGADPNLQGGSYRRALNAAALYGKEDVVQLLIHNGANINAESVNYGTALYATASRGHAKLAEVLLEKGADPNIYGGQLGTALFAAALEDYECVMDLLLQNGANPNTQSTHYSIRGEKYTSTPLYAVSCRGNASLVKLLLKKGANPNAQGRYHTTALFVASVYGFSRVVQLLLQGGADPNAQSTKYNNAPLYAASNRGHERVVELLLENGADPNMQGGKYGNALFAASEQGHDKVVKLLLQKDADCNARGTKYDNGPLYAASCRGYERVVELLLENGADPNMQGGKYGNALFAASEQGHDKVVKLLLQKDADCNARGTEYDNGPLYAASFRGHERVVKVLLECGADPSDPWGKYGNPLQAALARGHDSVAKQLLNAGAVANEHALQDNAMLQVTGQSTPRSVRRYRKRLGLSVRMDSVRSRGTRPWRVSHAQKKK
jgi:ankyrin repeat protein